MKRHDLYKKKTFFVSAQKNGENCIGVEAGGAVVPPLFKVGGGLQYLLVPPPLFGPTKMCSASQMP